MHLSWAAGDPLGAFAFAFEWFECWRCLCVTVHVWVGVGGCGWVGVGVGVGVLTGTGMGGRRRYAAPENIRSAAVMGLESMRGVMPYDGQKADIWSCGVVIYVFIYGAIPWEAATDTNMDYRLYKATEGHPNVAPWNRMPTMLRALFQQYVFDLGGKGCLAATHSFSAAGVAQHVGHQPPQTLERYAYPAIHFARHGLACPCPFAAFIVVMSV
jgi:hypothetical protein